MSVSRDSRCPYWGMFAIPLIYNSLLNVKCNYTKVFLRLSICFYIYVYLIVTGENVR